MKLIFLLLVLLSPLTAFGQDLAVHVFDRNTLKPLRNVEVMLKYGCTSPGKPKLVQEKTDSTGTTIFRGLSLSREPFCLQTDGVVFDAQETLPYLFVAPEAASTYSKSTSTVFSALPVEINLHPRRRNFGEQLHMMWLLFRA